MKKEKTMKWKNRIIETGIANPAELIANPVNFRKHPKRQQDAINGSLDALGWIQNVIVNKRTGRIIDGHLRVDQAIAHGEMAVPVQWVDLSEEEEGQALLSLDPIAAMADTNKQMMTDLLKQIHETQDMLEPYLEDIAKSSGIDVGDILGKDEDDPPDENEAESFRAKWGVESGQLWELGGHRVLCGDCTNQYEVDMLIKNNTPRLMVTDPPYGVEYDPSWRKKAGVTKSKRMGIVINDNKASWAMAWNLFKGDVAYIWHGGLHSNTVVKSLMSCGFEIKSQIIWVKKSLVLSRGHYHWRHEPCWYAVKKNSKANFIGNKKQNTVWADIVDNFNQNNELFAHKIDESTILAFDSSMTTVWEIGDDKQMKTIHSTQKPIECMARPIMNHESEYIYDPFLGSGTTLIACENLRRKCRGIEISPEYVAVTIERWHRLTGKQPRLLGSV